MADTRNAPDDTYARRSFSMRRMKDWQLWAITAVAIAVIVAAILYGYGGV